MNHNSRAGFSLVEILIVVVLIGILTTVSYPVVVGLMENGKSHSAIVIAQSLNAAKQSFRMKHFKAEEDYAKQGNDEAKFALIQPYIADSSSKLNQLMPKGYRVDLQGMKDRVKLWGPKGEIVY